MTLKALKFFQKSFPLQIALSLNGELFLLRNCFKHELVQQSRKNRCYLRYTHRDIKSVLDTVFRACSTNKATILVHTFSKPDKTGVYIHVQDHADTCQHL